MRLVFPQLNVGRAFGASLGFRQQVRQLRLNLLRSEYLRLAGGLSHRRNHHRRDQNKNEFHMFSLICSPPTNAFISGRGVDARFEGPVAAASAPVLFLPQNYRIGPEDAARRCTRCKPTGPPPRKQFPCRTSRSPSKCLLCPATIRLREPLRK